MNKAVWYVRLWDWWDRLFNELEEPAYPNDSGLKPLGRAVLLEPYAAPRGLIELPPSVQQTGFMLEMRAKVVEVGPHCWPDEPVPRAKVGDNVLVAKMSGALVMGTKDQKQYRVVNDRDIFLAITHEGEAK